MTFQNQDCGHKNCKSTTVANNRRYWLRVKICVVCSEKTLLMYIPFKGGLQSWWIQFRTWTSFRPTYEDWQRWFTKRVEQNPYFISWTFGQIFNVLHSRILEHIPTLVFVLKYARWVPHDLAERNRIGRV